MAVRLVSKQRGIGIKQTLTRACEDLGPDIIYLVCQGLFLSCGRYECAVDCVLTWVPPPPRYIGQKVLGVGVEVLADVEHHGHVQLLACK